MALDLPPLPGTQTRALQMVSEADISFRDLAPVVEADPALTAAVLRAANSAMSAPVRRIEAAEQALIRIGLEHTRRIVIGAVVSGNTSGLSRSGLDVNELWRHLIACALIADTTAWGEVRRTASFTAGLLHDVGRLAMAHTLPSQYTQVVAKVAEGMDPVEAEKKVFGVDHTHAGLGVARTWNIPDDIAEAIGDHHSGAHGALSWVTWNARRISWSLGIGDGLRVPESIEFDPESEDGQIVAALGGPEKLLKQVGWYTGVITGQPLAAAA